MDRQMTAELSSSVGCAQVLFHCLQTRCLQTVSNFLYIIFELLAAKTSYLLVYVETRMQNSDTKCILNSLTQAKLYCIVSVHLYSASCSVHQSEALPVQETQREQESYWETWS